MTETSETTGPNTQGRERRDTRIRMGLAITALLLVACTMLVFVTSYTGFPGPGAVHRYRTSELEGLADRINHSEGCWNTAGVTPEGQSQSPAVASVDWLRSRVHLKDSWAVVLSAADRPMVENPWHYPSGEPTVATSCAPITDGLAPFTH